VLWATVPEAPVHKDDDLVARNDEIRPAAKAFAGLAIPDAAASEFFAQ
jgi:hypothetical protein